ncbi:neprilysin-1-like [Haematobia irritans]|uniref:neprilysin-1-like n=1 Tax=Haematobia irritans TaxID=7368 RepID=UPI003F4FC3AD
MPPNISGSFALVLVFLTTIKGNPISVGQLNADHSVEIIRLTKATEMLKYFNTTADPCEDFFEYTCGNFGKYHPTNTTVSTFEFLEKAMLSKIKRELEMDDPTDTDIDKKVKNFYRSCISAPGLMSGYAEKLRAIINEIGHMPVLEGDDWQEKDFDWSSTVAKMIHKTGLQIFFEISVNSDLNDNSINRVALAQPIFALKDISLYVDETLPMARDKHKKEIAKDLHKFLGVDEALANTTAQEILDFEISLARGMLDAKLDLPLDEMYRVEDIEKVHEKYLPVWDTKKLINDVMGFTPDVLIVQPQYLANTFQVMQNASLKSVANFLFYEYITSYLYDLDDTAEVHEKSCLKDTKNIFYQPLVNLIYRKNFNETTKEGVNFMWHELKLAFENSLQSDRLKWMKPDTLEYAQQKLKAMNLEILTYEHKNFSEEFSELEINNYDYVQNMKAILELEGQKARAKFNKPPEPMIATGFSPFNVVIENAVKIPIDFLQPFYAWSSSYPYAYNFGSLGFAVAHEILHGFDDVGRSCDLKGNLQDWWDSESEREFRQQAKCFVDQYKSYSYGGRPLPEMTSQGENIADNGGVRLAYDAYLSWHEKHQNSEESFPGLAYNNRQLFFISYAQLWCAHTHPDYMALQAASDIHVPEKFRVIGPLSNNEEFAQEFQCPVGSAMNPEKKCKIY